MIPQGSRLDEAARMRSGGWGATPIALSALFLLSFPAPPGAVSSPSLDSGDSGECAQVCFPTSPPVTIPYPPPLPATRCTRCVAPSPPFSLASFPTILTPLTRVAAPKGKWTQEERWTQPRHGLGWYTSNGGIVHVGWRSRRMAKRSLTSGTFSDERVWVSGREGGGRRARRREREREGARGGGGEREW